MWEREKQWSICKKTPLWRHHNGILRHGIVQIMVCRLWWQVSANEWSSKVFSFLLIVNPKCLLQYEAIVFGSVWTATTQNWKDVAKIKRENEKWELSRELEMKSLLGPGFKLGFVPIFFFSHSPCSLSAPRSRSSNIPAGTTHLTRIVGALNHNLYFFKVFMVFIICLTKNTC